MDAPFVPDQLRDEGFQRQGKCGLQFSVCALLAGYASTIYHTVLFLFFGELWKGVFLGFLTAWSFHEQGKHGYRRLNLLIEKSLFSGFVQPELQIWFESATTIKSSFEAMIAPLGVLSIRHLSLRWAVFSLGFFLINVKSLADEAFTTDLGQELHQFGKAAIGRESCGLWKLAGMYFISLCNITSEIVICALVMFMWGPLAGVMYVIPQALARLRVNWNMVVVDGQLSWKQLLMLVLLEPLNLITMPQCSVFSVTQFSLNTMTEWGPKPPAPHFCAFLVQKCCIIVLLCFWSNSLHEAIIIPARHFLSHGGGRELYCFGLLFMGSITIPIYSVFVVIMFGCKKMWREGIKNEGRVQRMRTMYELVLAIEEDFNPGA